jgi:exosortase
VSTTSVKPTLAMKSPQTAMAPEKLPLGFWVATPLVLLAFVAIYYPNLYRLWWKTNPINGQTEWVHALFVPVIGIFYLFLNRDALLTAPVKPLLAGTMSGERWLSSAVVLTWGLLMYLGGPYVPGLPSDYANLVQVAGMGLMGLGVMVAALDWGLGSLLFGLIVSAYGIWPGQNDFIKDVGMVVAVFGIVLSLCGWKVMRIAWFPILFLFTALPWPGLFYSRVAMPLQEVAARTGVIVMNLCGMDTTYNGTVMYIRMPDGGERPLNVAEACAGLKSLMTFVALGSSLAFLSTRPLWQQLLITFIAIPIAVICNVFRVAAQGLLDYYGGSEFTQGAAHMYSGVFFLLVPGFAMLLGSIWLLDKLVVEEADDDDDVPVKSAIKVKGASV